MARLNRSWKVEGEGAALAAELHRVLEVSHRQAKGLIDAGCVKVAGKEAQSYGLRLEPGTEVCVAYDPERAYKEMPRPRTGSD
ncbi:MAG TPA: S4 domain-containing protein, partial [Holophaga sp.]|nr:S4 domain-containing protein [Holophaga sp.]